MSLEERVPFLTGEKVPYGPLEAPALERYPIQKVEEQNWPREPRAKLWLLPQFSPAQISRMCTPESITHNEQAVRITAGGNCRHGPRQLRDSQARRRRNSLF